MTAQSPEATDTQRSKLYETAQAIAPTWERRRPFVEAVTAPVREWLVRELAPQSGDTILELAAGAGDTGFDVAELIGSDGRLISSDFAPAMVDAARRRGRERGIGNVDYQVIDAERIPLDDESVDGALCRFGYMLMADPAAALNETRRVLRPGSRVVLAVWGPADRNPFFAAMGMALVKAGHMTPPDPQAPGPFNMAAEARTRGLLADAGLAVLRIDEVAVRFVVDDVDEYVAITTDTAGPLAVVLRGLSDADRRALSGGLEQALAPFATRSGYEIPGVALCASARRELRPG